MAIRDEVVLARADMNDAYGVSVWQHKKIVEYTVEQAEQLGKEILRAAAEARRCAEEDVQFLPAGMSTRSEVAL